MRALQIDGHRVFGYNRSAETVDAAIASGHDASTDLVSTLERAAVDDALLVLATPVTTIDELLTSKGYRHTPWQATGNYSLAGSDLWVWPGQWTPAKYKWKQYR